MVVTPWPQSMVARSWVPSASGGTDTVARVPLVRPVNRMAGDR